MLPTKESSWRFASEASNSGTAIAGVEGADARPRRWLGLVMGVLTGRMSATGSYQWSRENPQHLFGVPDGSQDSERGAMFIGLRSSAEWCVVNGL